MKYVSLLIALLLMTWTWSLATGERALHLHEHKQVEAGVEDDIRGFILRKYPNTSEIYCQQLFTEVIEPGVELVARFRCQAVGKEGTETATEQVFEGYLQLKSDDGFRTWAETGGEIRSPEIRFLKGIRVSPRDNDDETSDDKSGDSGSDGAAAQEDQSEQSSAQSAPAPSATTPTTTPTKTQMTTTTARAKKTRASERTKGSESSAASRGDTGSESDHGKGRR